ncbi:hypothetical protein ES703_122607 [subsurface metagenome]
MAKTVETLSQQQTHRMAQCRQRCERFEKRRNVRLGHHHAAEHREFRARRANACEIVTQEATIELDGNECASAVRRAGMIAEIIGMGRRGDEFHVGPRLQIIDYLWAGFEKHLP